MLEYLCEWCRHPKRRGERWILGLAEENIGAVSARLELTIMAEWSSRWASHPLAVHFCSEQHKDSYVRAMFVAGGAPRLESKRRVEAAGHRKHAVALCDTPNQPRIENQRNTRGATTKKKRIPRKDVDPIFTAPDGVRAHGLSVDLNGGGQGELP